MGLRLAREATAIGAARMAGRLYDLGDYPGAVAGGGADWVLGEMFQLAATSPLWQALDEYEETVTPAPEFARRVLEVTLDSDGRSLPCQVYVYLRAVDDGRRVPDGDWPAHLRRRDARVQSG